MPRSRRRPKARIAPDGLHQISLCERSLWSVRGPLLASDDVEVLGDAPYYVWPDWTTWLVFYASVRDELTRRESSVAERLFEAWQSGADVETLEALRDELVETAGDPREELYAA